MAFTNSPLVDFTLLSPNHSGQRTHEIDTITIHCVAAQCTVESLGKHFASPARKGSSNYGIGHDGRIGLYVEEKNRSWCSGGYDAYGRPIKVNGISGADNDHRAVTIEVASGNFHPYAVTNAAYTALLDLVTDICKRNNIKELKWKGDKSLVGQIHEQNMTVHRWFANKACPGNYLYERHAEIATEVNKRLKEAASSTIIEEDDDMDINKFKEMWLEMRKDLQDNDSSKWSEDARAWAISSGLIQGGENTSSGEPNYMWGDMLTREQFITVLYRFAQIMGKA